MERRQFIAGAGGALVALQTGAGAAANTDHAVAHESDESYDLHTPSGVIAGSLRRPANVTRPAVVGIIAGSGPTDRNGNAGPVRPDTYRLLADALESRGVATLRYDKRGIGSSAAVGSEADLRFGTYVDDAVAWIARLRADGRFGRVIVAGHSEGSLIGMLVAARTPLDGYVSLCGAAAKAADELRQQLAPKLSGSPALLQANERILTSLAAGQTVADVPAELQSLYRPSVQPYLISWFPFDPRVEIAKFDTRTVIVGGGADLQVPADDARALAAARPGARLLIVDGMSHVLKDATGMSPQQQATTVYVDPNLPIVSAVPDAIAALATA
jgi:pimeloyl-ACP methyl ester carboxylesterase